MDSSRTRGGKCCGGGKRGSVGGKCWPAADCIGEKSTTS